MGSIYNVSNAQTVESALVPSRHPATQSYNHICMSIGYIGVSACSGCVNILIADVKVRPDLIDMSSGMPVGQQELLQLRHRRRLIWLIPEGHTDIHTHARARINSGSSLDHFLS